MNIELSLLVPLATFIIIAFASESISKFFAKIHLPLISGLIAVGIVVGPYVLKLVSKDSIHELYFLFDISLAFIAFAAGTELFLKELKDNLRSIYMNTLGQFLVTFIVSGVAVYYMADMIPFMKNMDFWGKLAISLLAGTIFVARSPSSAIAIIRELRAKGPFVRTVMGVTVIKDVLVIVLFSITLSLALNLIKGEDFSYLLFLDIGVELVLAFVFGYLLGRLLEFVLSQSFSPNLKTIVILSLGYGFYVLSHFIHEYSVGVIPFPLHIEPLLVCIIASFYVTNYTDFRLEMQSIVHDAGPMIYVVFFTLTGASMSLDVLLDVWFIALILFFVRLLSMVIGGVVGGKLANDKPEHIKVNWMPYVTQAGVGIGLATIVALEFPEWGNEFYTIILGVIVLNQIVGPPLFKYAILKVGEAHIKAPDHVFDGEKDLLIFGLENQSVAIARNLEQNGWNVKVATLLAPDKHEHYEDVEIVSFDKIDLDTMNFLEADKIEAALLLFTDDEKNYKIAELLYEHFGTREVVVRINERVNYDKFKELKCYVVDPSNAMINLLMQYIKSPHSTSLLLGELKGQSSLDIEVRDPEIAGRYIRDLRLPEDVIILSLERDSHTIITHGNTQLEMGDIVTAVGSEQSLDSLLIKCSVV